MLSNPGTSRSLELLKMEEIEGDLRTPGIARNPA